VDQAASLLEGYLKKYPAARETRLAYARVLVAQKRFGEARAEFEKLMTSLPDSSDMAFAVALLSLQLKDYDAAERYLRRLIESPTATRTECACISARSPRNARTFRGAALVRRSGRGRAVRAGADPLRQVLARQGKLDEARARLQQAAAKDSQQRVQLVLAEAQLLRDANQPKAAFDLSGGRSTGFRTIPSSSTTTPCSRRRSSAWTYSRLRCAS